MLDKLRFITIEHEQIDSIIIWIGTILTLNSIFIGILLVGSGNTLVHPLASVSINFMSSIVAGLGAQMGLIHFKRSQHTNKLHLAPVLLFLACLLSFFWGLIKITHHLSYA